MAFHLALLLGIVFTVSFAQGEDRFINPPDGSSQTGSFSSYPVFAVGDIIDVSWVTNASFVDLIINQLNSADTQIDRPPNSVALARGDYTWKVTTDGSDGGSEFDLAFSNVFNFMLFPADNTAVSAQSAFFNISNATVDQHGQLRSASTSTPPTILPTSSNAAVSSVHSTKDPGLPSTPTSATAPANSTSSPETNGSLTSSPNNKNLKIGLGIGLGLAGVAAICGALVWCIFYRRKGSPRRILSMVHTQYTYAPKDGKFELLSTAPAELPS